MLRYIYDRLKNTPFGKKYLTDGILINFLRRVKHFGARVIRKLRSIFPKEEVYDDFFKVAETYLQEEAQEILSEEIDVIIPIYNGYEYLLKLFVDLTKTKMPCRFLLVDDKSTDERVLKLEQEFVAKCENAILLQNEENYGFVKSVNHGLAESKNHVALVNTDTELPKGWLERLMYPILSNPKVASTTPYTNSGTIFSFPDFCYNNKLYRGLDVDTLDAYFRMLKPAGRVAPTGVGFCMGMSKYALKDVGILDYETYGRGFGEENDWCLRAAKKGYLNVQVENLFVYHKHGGSFLSDEKEKLVEEHLEKLKKKFPSYDHRVSRYIYKDPNKKFRGLAQMLIDTHETKSVLYFDHSLGGGATSYLNQKKDEFLQENSCVCIIRYRIKTNNYHLIFENGLGKQTFSFANFEDIQKIGGILHFDEIYVNELVTYPQLFRAHELIVELKKQQHAKLVMLFHDLFPICPTVNLLDGEHRYCDRPDKETCEKCYEKYGYQSAYGCETREEWSAHWKSFLQQCDEVRSFSEDTNRRVAQEFGDDLPLTVVGHKVDYAFPIYKEDKTSDTLNIGLLGVLSEHKGIGFVMELLQEIEQKNWNVKVKLIGRTEGVNLSGYRAFEATGAYDVSQLPKLIYERDIDVFLITSIWPETFSYTTEEVIQMGMPIAAFELGAPPERIARYEKGLILKKREPAYVLEEISRFAHEKIGIKEKKTAKKKIVYFVEYVSFSSRYRIEHMAEELLYQGVQGEIWEAKSVPKKRNWEEVEALVIYRCRYQGALPGVIEDARAHGVRILYDIDDYIFEYDAIKDLPFMADKEYKDFKEYSRLIRMTMDASDGLIVSTDHLARVTRESFPEKPVLINRNVASAEMLIRSVFAARRKKPNMGKFVLGYFSGSHTHGRDFERIADVLLEFMKKHDDVYLKIVGCLNLPEEFRKVQDRILAVDFMDWQDLPDEIATVDVNLMPLEESFFHACKSENKWMEAALVKVPTIGSWNEEIANATKPMENILLCKNSAEWMEGLELLWENGEERARMAGSAFVYVLEHKTTLQKNRELFSFVMEERS